jgi:hypothetical protein
MVDFSCVRTSLGAGKIHEDFLGIDSFISGVLAGFL